MATKSKSKKKKGAAKKAAGKKKSLTSKGARKKSAKRPAKKAAGKTAARAGKKSVKKSAKRPAKKAAKKPVKKSAQRPAKKAAKKPAGKTVARAAKKPVKKNRAAPSRKTKQRKSPSRRKILSPTLIKIRDQLIHNRQEIFKILQNSREVELNPSELNFSNEIDLAASLEGREMAFTLSSRDRNELKRIEQALFKIARGTYGVCDSCSKPISMKRLQIMPLTPFCIECQSTMERP